MSFQAHGDSYIALFESAPVAIWHEDFSEVQMYLDEIRARGIEDLEAYLIAAPDVVRECVRRVRVLNVNRLARDFYGAATQEELMEMLPNLFDDAALDTFRKEIVAFAQGASTFEAEVTARTLGGTTRVVQMNVSLLPTPDHLWSTVVVAFTDVTERKLLENELFEAQKLESLGRLAGGVAHDLNNALTIINGYSHLLLEEWQSDELLSGTLREIHDAGERAARLTQQLLAFSRRQVLQPEVISLNDLISEARSVLRTAAGEGVELLLVLSPALPSTRVDPAQFSQVLLNLVLNARDAMPHGGKLEIRTNEVEIVDSEAIHLDVKPGRYVVTTVSDSGEGMDEETRRLAFDPFFTTKRSKGTGLGLSSAFGIIKQSSGTISISSQQDHGSVFSIYLPATARPSGAKATKRQARVASGTKTILVVEDQMEVRSFLTRTLARHGYLLLEAANAFEAFTLYEQNRGQIDLVVTDILMPGMTGVELVQKLLGLTQRLNVLYVSGFAGSPELVTNQPGVQCRYLQKPVAPDALASAVRELLD